MIIREQEPLKTHTTFRIGGPAAFYLVPESAEEVREALSFAKKKGISFYVLGRGSNILFDDRGYDGAIIEIGSGMEQVSILKEPDGAACVTAQAGIAMSSLAAKLAEEELSGFEFASGIPGTLGGGIAMNAGAYGGEIRDCIQRVTVITETGEERILTKEQMELGYRSSIIQKKNYIVLEGTFSFIKGEKEDIRMRMRELNQRRRDKQPLEYPSAGSTFKRPDGYFAGRLIEEAGLKGFRIGGAQVSEKHCGFVVNRGDATAAEVRELIQYVQESVHEKSGVWLEPEVRIIAPNQNGGVA